MLAIFQFSMNAVFPILLLVMLGYYARRIGMLSPQTLTQVNSFNFRFGYSAMLFINLYNADLSGGVPYRLIVVVLCVLLIFVLLGWAVASATTEKRSRKGVMIQATFRSNYAILGMMLAESLAGKEGTTMVAVFQLPVVLFFNVFSVLTLSIYSDSDKKPTVGSVLRKMATNPMILSILAGAAAILVRRVIPVGADGQLVFSLSGTLPWLYSALNYLNRMASPLAMIVLGATLVLSDARGFMRELAATIATRLVAAPVIGFFLVYLLQKAGVITLTPALVSMLVALFGSPAATASAIMAKEMDADASLAGQIVVWTSLLSMGSLFVLVAVLRMMGWL